jgi:hypothetical protein
LEEIEAIFVCFNPKSTTFTNLVTIVTLTTIGTMLLEVEQRIDCWQSLFGAMRSKNDLAFIASHAIHG